MKKELTATAKESKKKTANIEDSVQKSLIRQDLNNQISNVFMSEEFRYIKDLTIASLPANKWRFEYLMKNALDGRFKLNFECAEMDKTVIRSTLKNMPSNANVFYTDFNTMISYPAIYSKTKMPLICKEHSCHSAIKKMFDLAWADYCCPPSIALIEDTVRHMDENMNEKSLYYLTFCLKARMAGGANTLAKQFRKHFKVKGATLREVIFASIEKLIKEKGLKNIHPIYDVVYGGSTSGKTTMITMGFAKGLKKSTIKGIDTIVDNRMVTGNEELAKHKHKCYYMASNFNSKIPIEYNPKIRVQSVKIKVKKTAEEKRLDGAIERWESKWQDLTSEKKMAVAFKYGLSMRQFACKVAHKHGKLAKKKVK